MPTSSVYIEDLARAVGVTRITVTPGDSPHDWAAVVETAGEVPAPVVGSFGAAAEARCVSDRIEDAIAGAVLHIASMHAHQARRFRPPASGAASP